jgi:hypothetical protein
MNSEQAREAIADSKTKGMKLDPEKVLQGRTVRLSGDGVATFLLMGSYPLAGADNTWFWIVRRSGQAASVVLWVAGNCVNIKRTSSLGYRDIEANWFSAGTTISETFRYDGKTYRLARKETRSRRPEE